MSGYFTRRLVTAVMQAEPRLTELYTLAEIMARVRAELKPLETLPKRMIQERTKGVKL